MSKEVEYVLFTGTQCIDTGFKPNVSTTIEVTFALNSGVTDNKAIFGARKSASGSDSTSFTMWTIDSNKIRFDHYGTSNTISDYNPKEKHICKMTPTEEIIDGTVVKTHSSSSNISSVNLTLGKANTNNEDNYYGKCKIYSCKIYDGESLIRDYIPYKDDNRRFCMKDLVNDTLYYSATTTDLNGPFDSSDIRTGSVLDFDYTCSVQSITLPKGTYQLECWGAQGGYRSSASYGGKGGYSVGTITLTEKTPIYIYTGGSGNSTGFATNSIYSGGFNGGGYRYGYRGGGGASDIRIGQDSLYSRVIVAGGGGSDGATNKTGMYGGGTTGGSSSENYGSGGYGGTQTGNSWLTTTQGTTNSSSNCYAGFGFGGFGCYASSGYGGAGGGGWYGGSGSTPDGSGDDDRGGGGGSGYVYTSSTAKNYPSGCLLNSTHYLASASTKAGNTSFKSPTGTNETGHSGNGYVRITVIECKNSPVYFKHNGTICHCSNIYFKFNNSWRDISSVTTTSVLDFKYTGAVQSIILPKGTYKLECWGAQGGNRSQSSSSATVSGSGLGGYSIGTLTLTQTTTCYIYVGGKGGMSSSTGNVKVKGGFNGGGFASHESTGEPGNGGGGATDVRIAQDSLYARVIVAGGGGGSGEDNETGGYGGGETGGAGSGNTSLTQASQTSGGTNSFGFGLGGNTYNGGAGGGGWYGGASRYSVSSYSTGSDSEGGGGGSGYVYTSSTASNYPSGCLLNSSYYLTNAQTIAGNQSFTSPTGSSETGHAGNGFCRITNLNPKQYGMFIKHNGVWTYINL